MLMVCLKRQQVDFHEILGKEFILQETDFGVVFKIAGSTPSFSFLLIRAGSKLSLQCSDSACWVIGRASSCKNLIQKYKTFIFRINPNLEYFQKTGLVMQN